MRSQRLFGAFVIGLGASAGLLVASEPSHSAQVAVAQNAGVTEEDVKRAFRLYAKARFTDPKYYPSITSIVVIPPERNDDAWTIETDAPGQIPRKSSFRAYVQAGRVYCITNTYGRCGPRDEVPMSEAEAQTTQTTTLREASNDRAEEQRWAADVAAGEAQRKSGYLLNAADQSCLASWRTENYDIAPVNGRCIQSDREYGCTKHEVIERTASRRIATNKCSRVLRFNDVCGRILMQENRIAPGQTYREPKNAFYDMVCSRVYP